MLPLTKVTNKHLLPVYNKPMIYYPIHTLVSAGITEIMIVTGGEYASDFIQLLEDGKSLGITKLQYAYQQGHGGIADALKLAEDFVREDNVCVILGDNIIGQSIHEIATSFMSGAKIILSSVEDPSRFGVARFENNKLVEILEKPADPPSSMAVTGMYFYDHTVFDICSKLKPSMRGELEITDVNNEYLRRGDLTYAILSEWWTDAGTFASLHLASILVERDGVAQ